MKTTSQRMRDAEVSGRGEGGIMTDVQKLAHLRQAIKNVIDGNYPSRRSHRSGRCRHGMFHYECCERCIHEYLISALKEVA